MDDIDEFASTLLEEAKRFFERAVEAKGGTSEPPNLHAALMLAFCALEAHVNAVADEMSLRDGLSPHEQSILQEKAVRLTEGRFELEGRLQMFRLEDRIYFLHARFGVKPDLNGVWRGNLSGANTLRNQLTHPKGVPLITVAAVRSAIEAVIETIDALYKAVFVKPFPAVARGLASKLDF